MLLAVAFMSDPINTKNALVSALFNILYNINPTEGFHILVHSGMYKYVLYLVK